MDKKAQFILKVKAQDQGLRLDQFISKNLKVSLSRSHIQRLINAGYVRFKSAVSPKGKHLQDLAKADYKVKANDSVLVQIIQPHPPKVSAEKIPLEIIFEDNDILVLDKPIGLVTHPTTNCYSQTLVNALLHYGCPLSTINGPFRPGIVHRLDKDTSGLMVIAKNDFAHHELAEQFRQHSVKREYIAIVKGRLEHNEGIIDYPLARHPQDRRKMQVSFFKSRPALTRYTVLKRYKEATLLKLAPHTGRTHQLRVHLKFCGHPILGDKRYGSASGFSRLALHATDLSFRHPRSKKNVEFHSDIPQALNELIETLK